MDHDQQGQGPGKELSGPRNGLAAPQHGQRVDRGGAARQQIRRSEREWRLRCPHEDRRRARGPVFEPNVYDRRRRLVRVRLASVRDHADDGSGLGLRHIGALERHEINLFAKGVAAGKELPHELLVDDRDARSGSVPVESSTITKRDLEWGRDVWASWFRKSSPQASDGERTGESHGGTSRNAPECVPDPARASRSVGAREAA